MAKYVDNIVSYDSEWNEKECEKVVACQEIDEGIVWVPVR